MNGKRESERRHDYYIILGVTIWFLFCFGSGVFALLCDTQQANEQTNQPSILDEYHSTLRIEYIICVTQQQQSE